MGAGRSTTQAAGAAGAGRGRGPRADRERRARPGPRGGGGCGWSAASAGDGGASGSECLRLSPRRPRRRWGRGNRARRRRRWKPGPPQVGSAGAAAGARASPSRAAPPGSDPGPHFSPRATEGQAGAGSARGWARSRTPVAGDPSAGVGRDLGHPSPFRTHPDPGRGGGARRAQPRPGKTWRGGCASVRGLAWVAPLWLLGAAPTEVGLSLGIPESFCLSAEPRGRNCRRAVGSAGALRSLALSAWEGAPPAASSPSTVVGCAPHPRPKPSSLAQSKEGFTLFLCLDSSFM